MLFPITGSRRRATKNHKSKAELLNPEEGEGDLAVGKIHTLSRSLPHTNTHSKANHRYIQMLSYLAYQHYLTLLSFPLFPSPLPLALLSSCYVFFPPVLNPPHLSSFVLSNLPLLPTSPYVSPPTPLSPAFSSKAVLLLFLFSKKKKDFLFVFCIVTCVQDVHTENFICQALVYLPVKSLCDLVNCCILYLHCHCILWTVFAFPI